LILFTGDKLYLSFKLTWRFLEFLSEKWM
jgi:hypothetical protein